MQVNIHEAKTHLSKLIQQVLLGEDVIIAKANVPLVKLVTFHSSNITRKFDTAKDDIEISDNFDEIPEDFKDYI